MALITSIKTKKIKLDLKGKLSWGKASNMARLEHVVIKLETPDHYAIAEAPARPSIYGETPQSIKAIVKNHLAPQLIGLNINDSKKIQAVFASIANNQAAKAAIDIAIHEIRAKEQNKTLAEYMNAQQSHIRVSYILGINEPNIMIEEALKVYEQGVSVFKIKIGRDLQKDKMIIENLKYAFSDEVILYADANQMLSPKTAAHTLEQLAKLGISYIEEPLEREKIKQRAKLKQQQIIPIIADDSSFSLKDLERELDFDSFDILNIKPARTGYSESKLMLEAAHKAAKGIMIGSQASSSLGTYHSAILAADSRVTHPSELSFVLKLKQKTTINFKYKNGVLAIKDLKQPQYANLFKSS